MRQTQHFLLAYDPGLSPADPLKLLIIDEAQDLYRPERKADFLWAILRSLGQGAGYGSREPLLRIMLAVKYGISLAQSSSSIMAERLTFGVENSVLLHQQPDKTAPQLALAFSPEDICALITKLVKQVDVPVSCLRSRSLLTRYTM